MNKIKFSWDENKNNSNIIKHKISFEEARSVFFDENARLIHDPDHSNEEDRFLLMGLSENFKILVVVHCYRENDSLIRIISARKASNTEKKEYMGFLQ